MTPNEWIGVIVLAAGVGGVVFGILRWFYNRGHTNASQKLGSDNTHNDLYNKIGNVETAVNNYTKQNEKDHKLLFSKINDLKKDTATNMVSLAYIKGKIDIVLKKR